MSGRKKPVQGEKNAVSTTAAFFGFRR